MNIADLILILFGGLTAIFGLCGIIGHLSGLDRFLDRLSDSEHQVL